MHPLIYHSDSELNHNPESLAPLYIALRAYQTYLDEQYESRERTASSQDPPTLSKLSSPGEEEGRIGSDITALMNTVVIYLKSVHSKVEGELYEQNTSAWINQVSSNIRKWVEEIVRCGGGEVHNIASLTGGLVAQEIIKVGGIFLPYSFMIQSLITYQT